MLITGDFNSCRVNNILPSFKQYLDILTRRGNTLKLCYGNITRVHLPNRERTELKHHKPLTYSVHQWMEKQYCAIAGLTHLYRLIHHDPQTKLGAITDPTSFAGNLNTFYTQFDIMDC